MRTKTLGCIAFILMWLAFLVLPHQTFRIDLALFLILHAIIFVIVALMKWLDGDEGDDY